MRERKESGLSVRAFCENAGFHENIYYYWQKKLREAACSELSIIEGNTSVKAPLSFTEVRLPVQTAISRSEVAFQNQVSIEAAGIRIIADSEYPIIKLTELLREVVRPC